MCERVSVWARGFFFMVVRFVRTKQNAFRIPTKIRYPSMTKFTRDNSLIKIIRLHSFVLGTFIKSTPSSQGNCAQTKRKKGNRTRLVASLEDQNDMKGENRPDE